MDLFFKSLVEFVEAEALLFRKSCIRKIEDALEELGMSRNARVHVTLKTRDSHFTVQSRVTHALRSSRA